MAVASAFDLLVVLIYCSALTSSHFYYLAATAFSSAVRFFTTSVLDIVCLSMLKGITTFILYAKKRYHTRIHLIGMNFIVASACGLKLYYILITETGHTDIEVLSVFVCGASLVACCAQVGVYEWLKGRLRNRMSRVCALWLLFPFAYIGP